MMSAPEEKHARSSRAWAWNAAALLVFGLALGSLFHEYWRRDFSAVTLAEHPEEAGELVLHVTDLRFVIGLTARNAFTLLKHPTRLFDLESCYPTTNALAYGEPMITPGLLGVPAYWLSSDPLVTFNLVVLGITLISGFAMYWLVREWTGVPAAGIAAGLLYAFHETKAGHVVHFYAWDSAWTLLAFLFARRLFIWARWRDALGLVACISFQMGGSFYPLLSAAFLALPLGVWFLLQHGVRKLRVAQLALVVAVTASVAWVVFHPYLELRSSGMLSSRPQMFFAFVRLMPGGDFFPGWVLIGLAAAGLAFGRKAAVAGLGGDPRWGLLIAGVLVLLLAMGGNSGDYVWAMARGKPLPTLWPNPYLALAKVIPGLDVVRAPGALYSGTHLVFCILAGLGAAAAVRGVPRRYAGVAAALLILLAYVDTLRPRTLGLEPRTTYEAVEFRPRPQAIGFFRELERLGNSGPILELPRSGYVANSESMLLVAYHHRRTSRCYNSFFSPEKKKVEELASALPDMDALQALGELGFTTIVVHHEPGNPRGAAAHELLEKIADRPGEALLSRIYGNALMTAYEITE
jgi:hypothetical protein